MLTENDLKEMGIHTDICGWYNVEKMKENLDFIIEINKNIDTTQFGYSYDGFYGYDEFNLKGYEITVIGDADGTYDIDISVNGHTLAESDEFKILSESIATVVMRLQGYKGDFSANKVTEIIEVMKNANLEYSDYLTNNEW